MIVRENIDEAIKHLSPKTPEELLEVFLETNLWEVEDEFHKAFNEIEKKFGLNQIYWYKENNEIKEVFSNKMIDLFNEALEFHLA